MPVARCVSTSCRPRRKTIAVLVDFIDQTTDGYESDLRRGFETRCRTRDLNLLIVVGRALTDASWQHHNEIYRVLNTDCVDGLVLISPGLAFSMGSKNSRVGAKVSNNRHFAV